MISGEQQVEGGYPPPPGVRVPGAFSVSRTGPTVLRMVLGATLRQYREAAGISTAQAGFKIRATHSKISRMELGRVAVKQRDVDDLLILYGVTDDDERERLIELALQSAAPGWWHQYADVLPDWFERYIGLGRGAAEIRGYQVQFVPGLLQTRDYARSVIRIGNRHAPEGEIDRRVRVRMERQRLLTDREPPKIWAVLDEAALRRAPDGDAEMRAQIEHLLAVTELPHVTLQIVPFRSGPHSAAGLARSASSGLTAGMSLTWCSWSSSTPPPTLMTARFWGTAPSGTNWPSRPPSRARARKCAPRALLRET